MARAEKLCRLPDCYHLGVGRRVLLSLAQVMTSADDPTIPDDQRADRNFAKSFCSERNAHAATRALSCCHFALLSGGEHKITFDEIVRVMKETGQALPPSTGKPPGAALPTPTGNGGRKSCGRSKTEPTGRVICSLDSATMAGRYRSSARHLCFTGRFVIVRLGLHSALVGMTGAVFMLPLSP